jgi:predicted ATPase
MAQSLMLTGDTAESRAHYDHAIALYDPVEHRPLATRSGQDPRVGTLSYRSWALWMLGYPEAALTDVDRAISDARQIGHAATLMYALSQAVVVNLLSRRYAAAKALNDELVALADQKGSFFWKTKGLVDQGWLISMTGKASDAVEIVSSGLVAWRSTGSTMAVPYYLSNLARPYAELGQLDDAWRCIGEAITAVEATKERWCEAEVNRVAGEIALKSPEPDAAKAQGYFQRALEIAHQQQAKSGELRAAMSMARLWRDHGKREEARELLAPVYGWFTEGFDTLDLKEAKGLIEELSA